MPVGSPRHSPVLVPAIPAAGSAARGTPNSRSVAGTDNSESSTSRIVSSFSASSGLEFDKQEERGILRGRNPVLFALSDE